jgi:5-formyltetrahydrofolate cyclo-ligase
MASKEQARGHFRELRRKSAAPDRTAPGQMLLTCDEVINARLIASFNSYGDEPDTSQLNDRLRQDGKRVLIPEMNSDKSLTWFLDGSEVTPEALLKVDVVILPALAIDMRGVRLGQGGGSFDRALPGISGWKVALIDSANLTSDQLPEEEHDVRVDAVATELGVTRFTT